MKDQTEKSEAIVLQALESDRLKLLTRQPFIGTVLMHLELIPLTDGCQTAMTDGKRIFVNCKFYAKLDQEERLFVLAHETWHCVLLHFARLQTRDPHRFNIATDLEIHFILQQEKMKEPFVLPHDPAWAGLSAEEIYEKLEPVKAPLKKAGKDDSGMPTRKSISGKRKGKFSAENSKQNAPGENRTGENPAQVHFGKCSPRIKPGKDGAGFDEHVYQGRGENALPCPGKATVDADAVEKMRQIVIQAAQMIKRRRGTLPGHLQGIIQKLQTPELNWRELLKQFVTSAYGGARRWLPPARRYVGLGLYLQSRRDVRLNAVLAIDTSGSVKGDQPKFFTELANLLNSFGFYQLTVIQCDHKIQQVETFSDDKPLPHDYRWKTHGLGGTNFIPPFEYVRENKLCPQVMIYLTDGNGKAPEKSPGFPVLWVLTHDGNISAQWGKKIKLREV